MGAGALSKLDSDDERFIAKAVEEKATYHGRRHDTVMYTNRRVKILDLKNITNHSLKIGGKKPIKSSITAWIARDRETKGPNRQKGILEKASFAQKKTRKLRV